MYCIYTKLAHLCMYFSFLKKNSSAYFHVLIKALPNCSISSHASLLHMIDLKAISDKLCHKMINMF